MILRIIGIPSALSSRAQSRDRHFAIRAGAPSLTKRSLRVRVGVSGLLAESGGLYVILSVSEGSMHFSRSTLRALRRVGVSAYALVPVFLAFAEGDNAAAIAVPIGDPKPLQASHPGLAEYAPLSPEVMS
jgi:hypothetical protein